MKNINKYFLLLLIPLLGASCSALDFDETNRLSDREYMYSYFSQYKRLQTFVYNGIAGEFDMNMAAACDEAEKASPTDVVQKMNDGTWSARSTFDVKWDLYDYVRAANEFLVYSADVDFSRFENTSGYANEMEQMKTFDYEVRVLRAFYFFELAKRYGDILMPLTTLTTEQANTMSKTLFEDVIEFIVSECDACIEHLRVDYEDVYGAEIGRVTKGFAMAVKSRALLYTASKLHNPTMDKTKWEHSAKAALDIINTSYYSLDGKESANNLTSNEVVLFRMYGNSDSYELNNFPFRFTEGKRANLMNGVYPTQNLVDAFQTKTGYKVTLSDNGWVTNAPISDFDPSEPYKNRDPRFERSIIANGMDFKGSKIELHEGGIDNLEVAASGTPTGYYIRRYIEESTSFSIEQPVSNRHNWIIYRYAETLLTYAESMVEAFGNPNYKGGDYTLSAMDAIDMVRTNAKMPILAQTPAYNTFGIMTREGFLEALRNERMVEFAFESQRFWDIRRWMIGDETQKEIYGVKITKTGGVDTYARITYEIRYWDGKMYMYPIPESELFINSNLGPQNQGW